jgi:FKBP-type peptidyl-prolyl cis-trans isomerase FklB
MSIREKLASLKANKSAENLAKGQAFLAENAKREGVTSLQCGLQYEILQASENDEKPVLSNKVTCHYHGTTIEGKVFDSSVQRNKPATFPLYQVILGWQVGVQLMSLGSKFRFYVPADMAYGNEQVGMHIAPNSALIFEVELLAISN